MNQEQISRYLLRIGLEPAPLRPTADNLSRLQYAHLQTVPYENLDILAGIPISLEPDDLYEKVVERHRGGFCFELNRLFGELLRALGYTVTDYVARYWDGDETVIPKRRHQVLRVRAEDGEFLCDVGVGARIPLYPVPYEMDCPAENSGLIYQLHRDDTHGVLLLVQRDNQWRRLYSFEEVVQFPCDYRFASFWCERAPDSIFNRQYILSIRHGDERHTFDGPTYKLFTPTGVTVSTPDAAERTRIFADVFGLTEPINPTNREEFQNA